MESRASRVLREKDRKEADYQLRERRGGLR
jgi:hypothetical protein